MPENGLLIDTPLLEKLERLAIQWQKSLARSWWAGTTLRVSRARGQEFLDHRQFHHGDDLRAVNWRAYLRLEKLFLKMFQLEPRIPVRMLVDISQSMLTGASRTHRFQVRLRTETGGGAVLCGASAAGFDLPAALREKLGDPLRRAADGIGFSRPRIFCRR